MKAVVARPTPGVAPVPCDAMAHALKARQLLDVQVDQLARVLALIAHGRLLRLQGCQATQAAPGEPGCYIGAGELQLAGDLVCGEPVLPPEHLDHADPVLGRAVGNSPRAGRAVLEAAGPFRPVAGQPLAGGALADAKASGHLSNRLAILNDAAAHFPPPSPTPAGTLAPA